MVDFLAGLEAISFYAGNRFDLVQAGGGNTSVKTNKQEMLVKASGINLSEVTKNTGYVPVDFPFIRQFITEFDTSELDKKQRENLANDAMTQSKLADTGKPSIETFLHGLLNTFTLHTHPVCVNILAAQKDWKTQLLSLWPDAIAVPYHTPGIDLALALCEEMKVYIEQNKHLPSVVFLQNHGLIISTDNPETVISLTDEVTNKIEQHLNLDLNRYRDISPLQTLLKNCGYSSVSMICSDDSVIQQSLNSESKDTPVWPFCPDTLIYCGVKPVFLNNSNDQASIEQYTQAYHEFPKVLILNEQVYFCAASLKKAKEAQDLFKFHLLVTQHSNQEIQRLSLDEVAYLSNWDAEKYRQGV